MESTTAPRQNALERLALAHAERHGAVAQHEAKPSPTPPIKGSPERRLAAAHAKNDLARLGQSLRDLEQSNGGGYNVTLSRGYEMDRIRDRISAIKRHFPELVS